MATTAWSRLLFAQMDLNGRQALCPMGRGRYKRLCHVVPSNGTEKARVVLGPPTSKASSEPESLSTSGSSWPVFVLGFPHAATTTLAATAKDVQDFDTHGWQDVLTLCASHSFNRDEGKEQAGKGAQS